MTHEDAGHYAGKRRGAKLNRNDCQKDKRNNV